MDNTTWTSDSSDPYVQIAPDDAEQASRRIAELEEERDDLAKAVRELEEDVRVLTEMLEERNEQ